MSIEKNNNTQSDTGLSAIYQLVFEQFDKSNIKVCLMRDDPRLLDIVQEIDILIYPEALAEAVHVLESCHWVMLDTGFFTPLKRAFVYFYNGLLLKVDLHLAIIDGPLVYMESRLLLDSARQTDYFYWLPNNNLWYLHVVLHTILGKKKISQKYHARILNVLSEEVDRDFIRDVLSQHGLSGVLDTLLLDPIAQLSDVSLVEEYRKKVRKRLLKNVAGNRIRWFINSLIWKFGQLAGCRRGFVIAIIGPDGAGKSTFMEAMKQAMKKMEISRRTVYMGPWEYPISPISHWLRRIGASPRDKLPYTDKSVEPITRYSKLIKGILKRYLYYFGCLIDMWARYAIKIWPHLLLRRVVIADRYSYDLEVGFYNQVLLNSSILRRAIVGLVPEPSFTIMLDNDVDVIWQRKMEYPRNVIEKSLHKYREIAHKRKFYVLRTDEPVEQTVNDFIEEHWVTMMALRKDGGNGETISWYECYFLNKRR